MPKTLAQTLTEGYHLGMVFRSTLATSLSIAGSDSGGGAGVQADLKTFAALGTHGTSVITCITAQNPRAVTDVQAVRARTVAAQMDALFDELPPDAAKTGMLYNALIIRAVAERWVARNRARRVPLVVDPVMVATSGARLLKAEAVRALVHRLIPHANLLTPNLDEAEVLLGKPRPRSVEGMRAAARELHDRLGPAILVKGGHLRGHRDAVDVYWDGRDELVLSTRFTRGVSTHGSGCTYAAAITAGLARGLGMPESVAAAKDFLSRAIAASQRVGRHTVLNTTGF